MSKHCFDFPIRKRATFASALISALLFLAAGQCATAADDGVWSRCERGSHYCSSGCQNQTDGPACYKRCEAFYNRCIKTEGTRPSGQGLEWPIRSPERGQLTDNGILDGGLGFSTRAPAATGSPLGVRTPSASPAAGQIR